jgi:hypothetical protein
LPTKTRSLFTLALAGALVAASLVSTPVAAQAEKPAQTPSCAAFDDPVLQVVRPKDNASLLTPWADEADAASRYGFTRARGEVFKASVSARPGLVEVHRLHQRWTGDFLSSASPRERAGAIARFRYKNQGTHFYVSTVDSDCVDPVYRYLKGTKHRHAMSAPDRAGLTAVGWKLEGISFYAAPADDVALAPDRPAPTPSDSQPNGYTDRQADRDTHGNADQDPGTDAHGDAHHTAG